MPLWSGNENRLRKAVRPGAGNQTMCEGVPVAVYLQALSLLIGIVAVAFPVAIALVGFYVSRRFSDRIDGLAADLDEALDRIAVLENPGASVPNEAK